MLALGFGLTAAPIWAVQDLLARKPGQGAALLPIVATAIGAYPLLTLLIAIASPTTGRSRPSTGGR
jgi:hypothetical protein